jgi:anti-sigma factor RsiW
MNQQHTTTEFIIDYLHGELEPAADAALHVHLESCDECRALYNEQSRLSEALHAYAKESERDIPQGVVARIWDAVEKEHAPPAWRLAINALFRPVVAVPVAIALIAGIVVANHAESPNANIDVAYYLQDHAALTTSVPLHEGSVEPETLQNDTAASDQHWVASTGASIVTAER